MKNWIKLLFASVSLTFASVAAVNATAATTGILISVPSGTTLSLATIELTASRNMDTYSVQLYRVGGGEQAYMGLLRSDPYFHTEWQSASTWYASGISGYVAEDDTNQRWTWYLYNLPAGDYYIVYGGSGVVNSDYPLTTAQDLKDWLEYWFEYNFNVPTQGPYGKTVHDASYLMHFIVSL